MRDWYRAGKSFYAFNETKKDVREGLGSLSRAQKRVKPMAKSFSRAGKALARGVKRSSPFLSSVTRSTKKQKTASGKKRGGRLAVGKDAGLITSGKPVKFGKRSVTKYRTSNFGTTTQQDKIWIGASTTGVQSNTYTALSLSVLNHYLPKLGDIRTNLAQTETGTTQTWGAFQIIFDRESGTAGAGGGAEYSSAAISNNSLEIMIPALANQFNNASIRGYYPTEIFFTRKDFTSGTSELDRMLYVDKLFGKTKFTISIKGRFRFNNITPAGDGTGSGDIHQVDANPLSGKIFSFRNQRPHLDEHYVEGFADATTLAGILQLNNYEDTSEAIGGDFPSVSALAHLNAPPLRPKSVFKNVTKVGSVVLPPGGFKTYHTMFRKSQTLYTFMRDFSRARYNEPASTNNATSKNPPLGDSFLLCMRPTIKTTATEVVKVAYDYEYIYSSSLSSARRPPLPSLNVIE